MSELGSHFDVSLSVSFLCKYKQLLSQKQVKITVSIKMFGRKKLQGWYEESDSAAELSKK